MSYISLAEINNALATGAITMELAECGGHRGVYLFRKDETVRMEAIALDPWHVDQDDGLQYADYERAPGWAINVFGAVALSHKARKALQDFCREHEEGILAWCDGDEDYELPFYPAEKTKRVTLHLTPAAFARLTSVAGDGGSLSAAANRLLANGR
jgi:hypothetical protein